ncbi:hypothetical protein V1274_002874 [Bradyrhizobium sp. AZCC 1614]
MFGFRAQTTAKRTWIKRSPPISIDELTTIASDCGTWVTQQPANLWFDPLPFALELNHEPDELAAAGAATAAFARAAANAGGIFGQSRRILRSGQARRGAGIRHPRVLPVLAAHRHPPPSLGQHPCRRRRRGIYRPRQGIADRIFGRARDPGAGLSRATFWSASRPSISRRLPVFRWSRSSMCSGSSRSTARAVTG